MWISKSLFLSLSLLRQHYILEDYSKLLTSKTAFKLFLLTQNGSQKTFYFRFENCPTYFISAHTHTAREHREQKAVSKTLETNTGKKHQATCIN